jgi:UDP:flavonoid glycosyltransferase YjiC (YdhE family)
VWAEPWASPWPDDNNDPIVLVSFSSTDQKQGAVLRRVVEALTTLPVRGLVTLGQGVGDAPVSSTANVAVVRSAPHRQILAEAWLVVCHCGHGITMKTLAAGVPMVCIPMGRDQNDTAARVVYHGAGVRLPADAAAARIRTAVERVVGDGRFRANAARLASAIAEGRGTTDLVAELESLSAR